MIKSIFCSDHFSKLKIDVGRETEKAISTSNSSNDLDR
jgi:hypothetical protein